MALVTDRDLGWKAAVERLTEIDEMSIRIGYQSGAVVYPPPKNRSEGTLMAAFAKGGKKALKSVQRKGTAVAKVAAVQGIIPVMAQVFDGLQGSINKQIEQIGGGLKQGKAPVPMLEILARFIREAYRAGAYRKVRRRTGRLGEAIRGTVYDRSKKVGGDDPRKPKASDPIGGAG